MFNNDLSKISQVTDNIFLSGIFPLDSSNGYELLRKLNIKYILACVDRNFISEVHDKIMINNPNITILYLPYNDDMQQNLWSKNKNNIQIRKYSGSTHEFDSLSNQLNLYKNKPLIEIGYNFIDNAVSNGDNILVHCMAGISRSVSLVAYYLMKKNNISFEQAMEYIRDKRSVANPNECFKTQLRIYHQKKDMFTTHDAKYIIDNNGQNKLIKILTGR